MPWCGSCARYLSPPTVTTAGTCPECGAPVETGEGAGATQRRRSRLGRLRWSVKLLLAVFAVYVAFRAYQGIAWLVG